MANKKKLRSRLRRAEGQRVAAVRALGAAALQAGRLTRDIQGLRRESDEAKRLLDELGYLKVIVQRLPRERFATMYGLNVVLDVYDDFFRYAPRHERYGLQDLARTCHFIAEDVRRKVLDRLLEHARKVAAGEVVR